MWLILHITGQTPASSERFAKLLILKAKCKILTPNDYFITTIFTIFAEIYSPMKQTVKFLLAALILPLAAITASADEPQTPWQLTDAQNLRIINKGWQNTARTYTRLPAALADSVRQELWDLSECSTGIAIRFATNSKRIGIKYDLLRDFHMLHMADTGIKGTDLYICQGDTSWEYVNTNRPKVNNKDERICEATYVSNLDGEMHEYMVYLPLYDGVNNVWIKTDSGSVIRLGRPDLIDSRRRIVAYGTSIMQGGCASRTGMCSSNIISRELNCEVVNLGFSGQAKMDFAMARALADIKDVDLYLLDPVPNCTRDMCDSLTYDFVKIIRAAHPDVPIVMVEGFIYPYARYDSYFKTYLPSKNEAYRRNYERLKAECPDNLYYIDSFELDGKDNEGTVDGIHLTNLGFRHYVDKVLPVIAPLLKK